MLVMNPQYTRCIRNVPPPCWGNRKSVTIISASGTLSSFCCYIHMMLHGPALPLFKSTDYQRIIHSQVNKDY
ncbi:hypothetical protein I7I48_08913 [Histoplasma ohiense]|nr:hypothetical protein I7I48_08913 [Histoplasma ohiense (nom. inval.)]